MNPISSRTRSRNDHEQITTIRLRSSIRGLEGLIISLPANIEEEDDTSDLTYVETEATEESDEDSSEHQNGRIINFDKLNKFVVNKSNKPEDDCPICLDGFKCRQHCRKLQCSHVFHKKCVDRWLVKNVQCPVCRSSVQPLHHNPTRRNIRILRSLRIRE